MSRLTGKVAIVTGAASGISLGSTKLMAQEGAKVVATDIQTEDLQKGVKEIIDNGGDAIAVEHDVSKADDWQKVVDRTLEKCGKIDILVNNAGIFVAKGILETDLDLWNKINRVNSIHPGAVYTGMVESENYSYWDAAQDMKGNVLLPPYIGEQKDIGYGVVYPASDKYRYVTGLELVIEGGWITH